jgi:hypothetical protein
LRGFAIGIARDFRKNAGGNVLAIMMFSFNHRYCSRLHSRFGVESSNVDGVPKEVGGVGPARPAVVQYEIFAPDVFVNGYCTIAKPLFVCSFGDIKLSLNVDPLKLAVAA